MLMVQQMKGGGNTDAIFDQANPYQETNAGAGGARLPTDDYRTRRAKAGRALAEHRDAIAKAILVACLLRKSETGEKEK